MRLAAQRKAADPEWRTKNAEQVRAVAQRPEWKAANLKAAKERAARPEWHERMRQVALERLEDPAYRERLTAQALAIGFQPGPDHRRWKGGRTENAIGYVYLLQPDGTYKAEHRVVMEQQLGRPLSPDEDVHHIDGHKSHNEPDNLQVLQGSEHMRIHYPKGQKIHKRAAQS